MAWPRARPWSPLSKHCDSTRLDVLSWRSQLHRPKSATRCEVTWTILSARSRRNLSTPSGFGTRIFHKLPTKKFVIYSDRQASRSSHINLEKEKHAKAAIMQTTTETTLTETVREAAHRLTGASYDYDPLMDRIGDARFVLIGEASHGTHEFYHERAQITQRLITEKSFTAVAVEADWPDAYRINRYVRGASNDEFAIEALADFQRFPTWMWRNTDVVEFLEWLHAHNEALSPRATRTGFYGLDLYSLRASMQAVLQYLEKVDPEAAKVARARYACFDQFGDDTQNYGFAAGLGLAKSCEDDVVAQLVELQRRAAEYARRDRHMVETLETLVTHFDRKGGRAKVVVWAHNSHLGDARATQMSVRGELNVGQLMRERYSRDAVLVGFTTY